MTDQPKDTPHDTMDDATSHVAPATDDLIPLAARDVVQTIVDQLSACPAVAAIALAGSIAAKQADDRSDLDLYVFTDGEVPVALRRELALTFDPAPEIDHRFFGPTDEWRDAVRGISIDLTFWDRRWFTDELARVLDAHQPSLGYTTAFWYTLRHAVPLFDRAGWLAAAQATADVPYPERLRAAIIAFNQPLLCAVRSSYRHQIALAVARDDPVIDAHRVAAFLASLFDIVFAANAVPHPGEKRLLTHAAALPSLPVAFVAQVRALLAARDADVLPAIDALCGAVDAWLVTGGLAPARWQDHDADRPDGVR